MTVERMLRLIAGIFVLASTLLGIFVHPYFLWFTAFVGAARRMVWEQTG